MEAARIRSAALPHMCDEKRSKCARGSPRREHKAIDGPNVLRSKIVGSKSRHGAEAASVTHQDNEREDGKNCCRRHRRKDPKKADLQQEHRHEGPSPRECVGDPGPEDSAYRVPYAGDTN